VGVRISINSNIFPPSPNPLPPGEGEIYWQNLVKVLVENDTSKPGLLPPAISPPRLRPQAAIRGRRYPGDRQRDVDPAPPSLIISVRLRP
jgi:hypothetical protein